MMQKKILVLFILLLIPLVLAVTAPLAITVIESIENSSNKQITLQLQSEKALVVEAKGKSEILTTPTISSKEELLQFKQRSVVRLNTLNPKKEYFAVVTFNREISEAELKSFIGNKKVTFVKYNSYPQGSGVLPFPFDSDIQKLKDAESEIAQKMKKLNNVNDFKLINGFVAMGIKAEKQTLISSSQDSLVFLVDVGSIELEKDFPVSTIKPLQDVYFELNKFGR